MDKYRTDIDGLRAIAVLTVILFHIDHHLVPGGFLGVDIFFVISGYLITGIVYKKLVEKKFSYSSFYIRRIRRLLPALIATLVLSGAAAFFLFGPEKMIDYGASSLHAIFGLSNFYFYSNAGYFDVEASARPLLHTWSLGVEEQFYLFWPTFLFLLIRLPLTIRLIILGLSVVASTLIGQYQIATDPNAAFYLLPARVAELSIGGIASILGTEFKQVKFPAWLKNSVNIACLAGLAACFALYNSETPFPGINALLPSLLTAGLLMSPPSGSMLFVLGNPVMRWIGLISYSAYLLHWPAIVFTQAYTLTPLTPVQQILLVAFPLIGGTLFYHFIETPFRSRSGGAALVPGNVLGFSVSISVIALTMFSASAWSGQSWTTTPRDSLYDTILQTQKADQMERAAYVNSGNCHIRLEFEPVDLSHCLKTDPRKTNILVLGSSFAGDDWYVLTHTYPEANVQRISSQTCPSFTEDLPNCRYSSDFLSRHYAEINQFDVVILSHPWNRGFDLDKISRLIDNIQTKVVIFGVRGILTSEVNEIFARETSATGSLSSPFIPSRYVTDGWDDTRNTFRDYAQTKNIGYVDVFGLIRQSGGLPFFASRGHFLIVDKGHYSPAGALSVAGMLRDRFPTPQSLIEQSYGRELFDVNLAAPVDPSATGMEGSEQAPASAPPIDFETADVQAGTSFDVPIAVNGRAIGYQTAWDENRNLEIRSVAGIYSDLSEINPGGRPGISIELPLSVVKSAKDRTISVNVEARAAAGDSQTMYLAYSTNRNGNSGWHEFELDPEFRRYSFEYRVPEAGDDSDTDYLGILSSFTDPSPITLRAISIEIID